MSFFPNNSVNIAQYKNYIGKNSSALNGAGTAASGWLAYANTSAANIPEDGTGGAATGLTFGTTVSSPLDGAVSFIMTQANSTSLQGKGVAYDFTIDASDKAQVLSIGFNYNASSTFVAANGTTAPLNDGTTSTNAGNSDIEVFIYDVTNSRLIVPTPQVLTAKGDNNFRYYGTFQTSSDSTSYRLIFHVATASANATGWTFKYDNVVVSPQTVVTGAPIEDWKDIAVTLVGASNNTAFAGQTTVAKGRRVGDSLEFQISTAATGAFTAGSGSYQWKFTNYTIDSTKLATSSSGRQVLGQLYIIDVSPVAIYTGDLIYTSSNGGGILAVHSATAGAANEVNTGTPITPANGDMLTLTGMIPVTGFSSTVQMSNDTDTRECSVRYVSTAGTSIPNSGDNIVDFATLDYSSHGNVTTGASWKFTCVISGKHQIKAMLTFQSAAYAVGDVLRMAVYKNGALHQYISRTPIMTTTAILANTVGVGEINLIAGDYIDIRILNNRTAGATSLSTTAGECWVAIERLSGPSAIAVSDSVVMATNPAPTATITGTASVAKWASTTKDSHGAYNASTGLFTVPVSGTYLINGQITVTHASIAVGQYIRTAVFKTGTEWTRNFNVAANTSNLDYSVPVNALIPCLAGDTLAIYISSSGTTPTIAGTGINGFFNVTRVGNY